MASKRTTRAAVKTPFHPPTPGHERPGYAEETDQHRLARYADDRKKLSSKYALSKAEAATLRSSLSQEQETTRALRAELASVQSSDDVEADVSVYRATIERLTTAVSEQAHAVTSARVRSDAIHEELEAANARVDAANELAEDLSRQRELHVDEICSLKAQLVSRLAEIDTRCTYATFEKC